MFQYTSEICFQTVIIVHIIIVFFSDSSATLSLMNRIQIDYEIEFRKKLMHKGTVYKYFDQILIIIFFFVRTTSIFLLQSIYKLVLLFQQQQD